MMENANSYFSEFLKYIDIDEEKYWKIIDKVRPTPLKNEKWFLKHKVWQQMRIAEKLNNYKIDFKTRFCYLKK